MTMPWSTDPCNNGQHVHIIRMGYCTSALPQQDWFILGSPSAYQQWYFIYFPGMAWREVAVAWHDVKLMHCLVEGQCK